MGRGTSWFPPRKIRISRCVSLAGSWLVHLGRCQHSIGVDGDCVLDTAGVAAGQGNHHRDVMGASGAKHQFVAAFQSFNREVQSAKLVFAIRICSGHIADKLGLELPQAGTQGVVQPGKIFRIAASVAQVDINRRRGLFERVIVFLMQRDGEHLFAGAFRRRWQLANRRA